MTVLLDHERNGRDIIVNERLITYIEAIGLQDCSSADLMVHFGGKYYLSLQFQEAQQAWQALGLRLPPDAIEKPGDLPDPPQAL